MPQGQSGPHLMAFVALLMAYYRQSKRRTADFLGMLPDIRFHDLRHTSATMLLSAGIHPKVVQERLGHAQISVTLDTYSHVLPGMQREAAAKFDEMLAAKPAPPKKRR